jgi:predicted DNA-binding transcriptional regulator
MITYNTKDLTDIDVTTLVGLLTEVQKDELIGVAYAPDSFYNPIQDLNENWIISVEEIANTINPDTEWVKDLPLTIYIPKPTPSPF